MASRIEDISRVLDASANEQQIHEMYEEGMATKAEYQALLDCEQIRIEQSRRKQELIAAQAEETLNQFWIDRLCRHRFYSKVYPEYFAADEFESTSLSEYARMKERVADDCARAEIDKVVHPVTESDHISDGVSQFPCMDRVVRNKDSRPMSYFPNDFGLSQSFLRESYALYHENDSFRPRNVPTKVIPSTQPSPLFARPTDAEDSTRGARILRESEADLEQIRGLAADGHREFDPVENHPFDSDSIVESALLALLDESFPKLHIPTDQNFPRVFKACLTECRGGHIGDPQLFFDFGYSGSLENFSLYTVENATTAATLMLDILTRFPIVAIHYIGVEMIMNIFQHHPMSGQFAVLFYKALSHSMQFHNDAVDKRILAAMGEFVNQNCVVRGDDISFCLDVLNSVRVTPMQLEHAMAVFCAGKKMCRIREQIAWARCALEWFRFEPKWLQRALLTLSRLLEVYTASKRPVNGGLLPDRPLLAVGNEDIPYALVDLVCHAVDICPDNRKVAGAGSLTLGYLAELSRGHLELVGRKGVRTATYSYRKWPGSYSSCYNLCKIYSFLGQYCSDLVDAGAHHTVLDIALKFAPDPDIARWALEALIRCDKIGDLKLDHEMERHLSLLGGSYTGVPDVLELVCICMRRLAECDDFFLDGLNTHVAVAVPLCALDNFASNDDLVEEAAKLVVLLTSASTTVTHRRLRALPIVAKCLHCARQDIGAATALFGALGNLACDAGAVADFMATPDARCVDLLADICLHFDTAADDQRQLLCALAMRAWILLLARNAQQPFARLGAELRGRIESHISRMRETAVPPGRIRGSPVVIQVVEGNRVDGYPTYEEIFAASSEV